MSREPLQEAQLIREQYGAAAVANVMATTGLCPSDAWDSLGEACQKMARVALARYARHTAGAPPTTERLGDALTRLFPPPVPPTVYLACAIRSVVKDARRKAREVEYREVCGTRISADGLSNNLVLENFLIEARVNRLPEVNLLAAEDQERKTLLVGAVQNAYSALSEEQRTALRTHLVRRARRGRAESLPPATPRERQNVCRAREALRRNVLRLLREAGCEEDFAAELRANRRSQSRCREKRPSASDSAVWTEARQSRLLGRLAEGSWLWRVRCSPDGSASEATLHELNTEVPGRPPSAAEREVRRILDRYAVKASEPQTAQAAALWAEARELRRAGRLEEAIPLLLACYQTEKTFVEARIAAGVTLFRLGRLQEARTHYLDILTRHSGTVYACIAASNLSEIYLTWFKAGRRDKERHIENALHYARLGLGRITPVRAANYLLACVADRRFFEAEALLADIHAAACADCPLESLLRLLFTIRENDLLSFWNWLEERGEEPRK